MKKIVSLALAVIMLLSVCPMVYAADVDYQQGTQVVYEATGTESYTITVPALLAPGGSGTVTLSGTWADNRTITVTADPDVTLTNSIKAEDQKVLDVYFDGISEAGSNTGSQTFTETVSVEEITNALFGTWSGKFNYNVEARDAKLVGYSYNGYIIPLQIPELDGYQYAYLTRVPAETIPPELGVEGDGYELTLTSHPVTLGNPSYVGTAYGEEFSDQIWLKDYDGTTKIKSFVWASILSDWDPVIYDGDPEKEYIGLYTAIYVTDPSMLVWSNTDILNCEDNSLYMAASNSPVPVYE